MPSPARQELVNLNEKSLFDAKETIQSLEKELMAIKDQILKCQGEIGRLSREIYDEEQVNELLQKKINELSDCTPEMAEYKDKCRSIKMGCGIRARDYRDEVEHLEKEICMLRAQKQQVKIALAKVETERESVYSMMV